ncbi:MAG: nitrous oxide reductase accessory protein NosL [Bacteroidia bacterium]|nr:nitrous oxide reductase accessory protein NosL [Bacteroidia bacterium]
MKKLSILSRIVIGLSSLLLIATYFVPMWRIDLFAPQYPEGLVLKIWLTKLSGDVDIINGVNHYIGMAKIKAEMFPEFGFLTYAVAGYILLALIIPLTGSRKMLYYFASLTLLLVVLVLYDLYKWGYQYGHNLDPKAAIKVPGMAYQPPVIGHKKLLNFDTYSFPDIGGFIFVGFGLIIFAISFMEWKKDRSKVPIATMQVAAAFLLFTFVSCGNSFKPINYGKDECDNCKMTIVDKKFAVEILSGKGKAFKFDDLSCAKQFVNNGNINVKEIKDVFINNFNKPGEYIKLKDTYVAESKSIRSPMGGNMAAFASVDEVKHFIGSHGGTSVSPQSIIKTE